MLARDLGVGLGSEASVAVGDLWQCAIHAGKSFLDGVGTSGAETFKDPA